MELADADFLIVAELHFAVLGGVEAVLDEGQVRHVLFEHRAEHAEFGGVGPQLVGAQQVHRHAMRDRLALLDAGEDAHLHQAGVGRLARPPAIDDVGHEAAPRREVGEHVIDQPVEQFGVGGIVMVVAGLFGIGLAHGIAERLARGLALGHLHRERIARRLVIVGRAAVELDEFVDDPLLRLACGVEVWRDDAEGDEVDVHVVAPGPVGGVAVAGERQQLGVGDDGVPSLHEGFGGDFPVGRDLLGHPDHRGAFFMPPALEVIGQGGEEFLQAGAARFLAQEDVAGPAADLGFGQLQLFLAQVLEVPRTGHLPERAVGIPRKAMERAGEGIGIAVLRAQLAAAVQADVVEGADRAVLLPRDEPGPAGILEHGIVARLGNVLLARSELPDVGPHPLPFGLGEFGAGIAGRRQRLRAAVLIAFLGQYGRGTA